MTKQKSDMENPNPIPIPLKHRWREFRIAYLPVIVFALLILAIVGLWSNYVQPNSIIGEVEMIHANVISTVPGTIVELKADRLQTVIKGQELAVIRTLEPEQLTAELAAAEADLRLMKTRMDIDKTRNSDSFTQLKTALLSEKLDLEVSRIRLKQTEGEFDRAQKLLDLKIIPSGVPYGIDTPRNDLGYDVALRDRDALRLEVASHESTIQELERSTENMRTNGMVEIDPVDSIVENAITAQRKRIEQLNEPIVLRAPVDGFISEVNHHSGEKITAGEPIFVVSPNKSDRVVAWVHQPISVRPQVGDTVEVRRLGMGQMKLQAKVIQVGSQLEPVSPMLRSPTANPERIEVGLPLLVQADAISQLIPGEPVLLRLLPAASSHQN
jgi:multidrug resistance efflux pump